MHARAPGREGVPRAAGDDVRLGGSERRTGRARAREPRGLLRRRRRDRGRLRVQLALKPSSGSLCGGLVLASVALTLSAASADVGGTFSTTTTAFYESGGPLDMTVITPAAEASVDVGTAFGVRAGYSADVVSGASVAVV